MLAPEKIYDQDEKFIGGHKGLTENDKFNVEFTNNTILNSKSVIRFHMCAYQTNKEYLTVDTSKFIVSNNKLGKITDGKVGTWWFSENEHITSTDQRFNNLMSELEKLF